MSSSFEPTSALPSSSQPRLAPLAVILLSAIGLVVFMEMTGRVWWCSCGSWNPVGYPVKSLHNSQHLLDAYSTSHLLHGVIFYFALLPLARHLSFNWRLAIAVVIETGWEILENSPIVLQRYRDGTAALGYEGDSITNGIGDLLSAIAGVYLAKWIGWKWSIIAFLVIELAMLYAIRDNLTLNVLMLLWPIEAIKQWQLQA